jgi:hypothetical protein
MEHLKNDPNLLYKARFRRGCAYEKAEKYTKALGDIQFCREKQPFNQEVTNKLNHIKDALEHEAQEFKARNKMSSSKLKSTIEEHKNKGNKFFTTDKLGKSILSKINSRPCH